MLFRSEIVGTRLLSEADVLANSVDITASTLGDDGVKSLTATIRDVAGNTSAAGGLSITLDTLAPSAPTLDLDAGSDSGDSTSDDLTNDATPTIRVSFDRAQVSAGAQVTLLSGGVEVGGAILNPIDLQAGFVNITTAPLGIDGAKIGRAHV